MVPDRLHPKVDVANRRLLLAQLQDGDVFDVDLRPADGDRLAITLPWAEADKVGNKVCKLVVYGYELEAGRWEEVPFNSFSWQWYYDRVHLGKVRQLT